MLAESQRQFMRTRMRKLFSGRQAFGARNWAACVVLLMAFSWSHANAQSSPVGIFENHSDVGTVLHSGSVDYDAPHKTYTITGSGENMWSVADAFQFVWKKMSGDVSLTADISFL